MVVLTNTSKQDHNLGGLVLPDGRHHPGFCVRAGGSVEIPEDLFARLNTPALSAIIASGRLVIGAAPAVAPAAPKIEKVEVDKEAEEETKTLLANFKRSRK